VAIHLSFISATPKAIVLFAVACGITVACGQSGLDPVAPDAVSVVRQGDSGVISTLDVGAHRAMAAGHAVLTGEGTTVQEEEYSFTARSTGSSLSSVAADGQVEVHYVSVSGDGIVHARVTCLAVVGNEAWIGSRVSLHILNGQQISDERSMVFRVQDGGNPSNTIEHATLVYFSPAADFDLNHCQNHPAFPPVVRNSERGNITVTSAAAP
jgi:hypothetical protein